MIKVFFHKQSKSNTCAEHYTVKGYFTNETKLTRASFKQEHYTYLAGF